MLADPRASAETEDHVAGQATWRREIDIFQGRGVAELRVAEPLRQAPLLARRPFGLDEQADAILETEVGVLARPALLVEGLGHGRQM